MAPQPNFIVFLTDDQGYGDLSCMGATDVQTPQLDRLAAEGVRFTSWYANSPVCSPSRAALLTGRYPGNAGVRSILAGHRTASGLPPAVPTLATALKQLGYQTAMFGKWHLGVAEGSRPHDHGFDEWFGFLAGCVDYYSHIFYWGMAGKQSDPRESRNWLDGRTDPYYGGTAGMLKGHKFSLYEGGIRVPGILRWSAKIPGGRVSDVPVAAMDVYPTFLQAAGGDPNRYELDGHDLLPMLSTPDFSSERSICWEMNDQTAIRRGRWKLVLNGQLVEGAPSEDTVHLADLETDPGERCNLRDDHPSLVDELVTAALAWRATIEDRWTREWLPRATGPVTHIP